MAPLAQEKVTPPAPAHGDSELQRGIRAIFLGPPGSGKGTQVRPHRDSSECRFLIYGILGSQLRNQVLCVSPFHRWFATCGNPLCYGTWKTHRIHHQGRKAGVWWHCLRIDQREPRQARVREGIPLRRFPQNHCPSRKGECPYIVPAQRLFSARSAFGEAQISTGHCYWIWHRR